MQDEHHEHEQQQPPCWERLKLVGHCERHPESKYYPAHFIYQDEETGEYWFRGGIGMYCPTCEEYHPSEWFLLNEKKDVDFYLGTIVPGPLEIE